MSIKSSRFSIHNRKDNPHSALIDALKGAMDADDVGDPLIKAQAWKNYNILSDESEKRNKDK